MLPKRDFSDVTLIYEDSVCFDGRPCVLEFGSFMVVLLKPLFGLPWLKLSQQGLTPVQNWEINFEGHSRLRPVRFRTCDWNTSTFALSVEPGGLRASGGGLEGRTGWGRE